MKGKINKNIGRRTPAHLWAGETKTAEQMSGEYPDGGTAIGGNPASISRDGTALFA